MTLQHHKPETDAVKLHLGRIVLEGNLSTVPNARGTVLFAHGSGSSRHSPRNRYVAERLRNDAKVATLLVDLLTSGEELIDESTRHLRFDIGLLAERLAAATDWVLAQPGLGSLPVGYFGASTGAAAALLAASSRPEVKAVVSRGGRPDLAHEALEFVRAPTLLIVGSEDPEVLTLNRSARAHLKAKSELSIISGASHLFEEAGALEEVARLAADWFSQHLTR